MATASGVIAALAAAREGKQSPFSNLAKHVGGMSPAALALTDWGNRAAWRLFRDVLHAGSRLLRQKDPLRRR